MIEHTTIDGRPCTVGYFTKDLKPSDPDDAEIIKVHFDDGETLWAYPKGSEEKE